MFARYFEKLNTIKHISRRTPNNFSTHQIEITFEAFKFRAQAIFNLLQKKHAPKDRGIHFSYKWLLLKISEISE